MIDFILIVMTFLILYIIPAGLLAVIIANVVFKGAEKELDKEKLKQFKAFQKTQKEAEQECIKSIKTRLYDQHANIVDISEYKRGRVI